MSEPRLPDLSAAGPVGPEGWTWSTGRWGLTALTAVVAVWDLVLLAGWLPHYLTWPWYLDQEHFAMVAQLWDRAGKLPYRDVFSMQFPGEIYLFWGMGRLFGWGNTVAVNAVDAGMVVGLGVGLVAWSRREFGRSLPGLIGFSSFLVYYLDGDFTFAGQRDWHASFYAAAGLLALLIRPGRVARWLSAIGYALAVLTRPQFALLAPAMLLAVDARARRDGEPLTRSVGPVVEWGAVGLVGLALGFLPLVWAGIFDDFLRCLRSLALGSNYNKLTPREFVARVVGMGPGLLKDLAVPVLILALSRGRGARRVGWTLVAAMGGMALYLPISPNAFPHYMLAYKAMFAISSGFLAGLLLELRPTRAALAASLLLFGLVGVGRPEFWTFRGLFDNRFIEERSGEVHAVHRKSYGVAEAIGFLRSGILPVGHPPGYREDFRPYPWDDIRATILYLREQTDPSTPVANFAFDCQVPVTGVIPRLSPLPYDYWSLLTFPDLALEADVGAIRTTPGCVVVWSPDRAEADHPRFSAVWEAVRDLYRPEARFGLLEVWRRSTVPRPATPGPSSEGAGSGGGSG